MRGAGFSCWLLSGLMLCAAFGHPSAPLGIGQAVAREADEVRPRAAARTRKPSAATKKEAREVARFAVAKAGFQAADQFRYTPVFAAGQHDAMPIRFPTIINPLVSQPYPATPDYTYLYVAAPLATTTPSAANYRYVADNRFLLSPQPGDRSVADAYSWNESWIQRAAARRGQVYRAAERPSNARDASRMRPDGFGTEAPPSDYNENLRGLRLPAR